MATSGLVGLARTILIFWAGFWTWFCVAEGISEPLVALVTHGWMVALMWLAVYLSWKRPETGGWTALAIGLTGTALLMSRWFNGQSPYRWFLLATLTMPPVAAGLMLLLGSGRRFAPGS